MLTFHGAKTSSLSPLHFSITLRLVVHLLEPEALITYRHHQPPSLDRPTLTLHYYKKNISILATFPKQKHYVIGAESKIISRNHAML
jgi:hypothetical protein